MSSDTLAKVVPPALRTSAASIEEANVPKKEQPRFKTILCKNFEKGNCKFGDKCLFAHGSEELRETKRTTNKNRGPLYKTMLCKNFEQGGECKHGNRCLFAHGEQELRKRPRAASHRVRQPNNRTFGMYLGARKPIKATVDKVPAFEYHPAEFPLPAEQVLAAAAGEAPVCGASACGPPQETN